jgi:hypothetical protein
MSGSEEESTNEASISIAFFLPFFPLAVPLPLPLPVVLVTYEHNDQDITVKSKAFPIFFFLVLEPTLLKKFCKSLLT